MNSNIIAGIKEDELNSLALEILDYSDKISEIFNKFDTKVEMLSEYYKTSAYKEFVYKYNLFRKNYTLVTNNIISYSDDLIALVHKMRENENFLTNLFIDYTEEAKTKLKNLNER